jgi:MFS family permease
MIVGGILGALVIPTLSDKLHRRTLFILVALAGATAGLAGITYATSYWLLIAASFVMGFFLLSAGPIGFQYGAEITYPTPEGTSNGLLILMGQISGIAFIFAMDSFRAPTTGSMTLSLIVLIGLMVLSLVLAIFLKEPRILLTGAPKPEEAPLRRESAL